jgi:kynurenine formamidase
MPRVIDLSRPISEELPIEIGEIKFDRDYDYADRGFRTHQLSMHLHNGTHVDAPEHTERGGAHIDEISPDLLYGPGVVLDLSPYSDEDVEFTLEHIQAAEAKLDEPIKPDDFVLLRSDWSSTYGTDRYWPKSPYLSEAAAIYLVQERKVRALGYDFSQEASGRVHQDLQDRIDRGEAELGEELVIHHAVLGAGRYHVECLTNLNQITAQRFTIVVAPLPLKGVEAAPARVFVIED